MADDATQKYLIDELVNEVVTEDMIEDCIEVGNLSVLLNNLF